MKSQLIIRISGQPPLEMPLAPQTARLGSDPRCEVCISHPEVASHAATLDYRNGQYLVSNLNPFVVYLGSEPLPPHGWVAWSPGEKLQLTRNVALQLAVQGGTVPNKSPLTPAPAGEKLEKSKSKNWVSLVVIAVCVLAAAVLLISDPGQAEGSRGDDFQQLVEQLRGDSGPQRESVLRLLQTARQAEKRRGKKRESLQHAIDAYRDLLEFDTIRRVPVDGTSLESRVKGFAASRLLVLESS